MGRKRNWLVVIFVLRVILLNSQTAIFTEPFNESNGSTTGNSVEGESWSTDCPTCVPGVDYFATLNGKLRNLDSNGPATFSLDGGIDVSHCSSIKISFEFAFSEPWEGSGNMEYCDEVNGTSPACTGSPSCGSTCDPSTPLIGACDGCWDFLWTQIFLDGNQEAEDLIGGLGTTDMDQSGMRMFQFCTEEASLLDLKFTTQTWANDEWVEIDNIVITCWENDPLIEIAGNQGPINVCAGEDISMCEINVSTSKLNGGNAWAWNGPGGSSSGSNKFDLFDVQASDSGNYVVTSTDSNNCTATDDIEIIVEYCCDANAGTLSISKN